MTVKIKGKFKIRKMAWLTHNAHRPPADSDSDDLGSCVYMKKGEKIEVNEDDVLMLRKGVEEDTDLLDSVDVEFDILEIEKEDREYFGELFKPGLDEKPNTFRHRIRDPKQFDRFFVYTPKGAPGVKFVMGVEGKEGSKVQSVIFSKGKFTAKEAKKWIKDHMKSLEKGETLEKEEILKLLDENIKPLQKSQEDMQKSQKELTQTLSEHTELLKSFKEPPDGEGNEPVDVKLEIEKSQKATTEAMDKHFGEFKKSLDELGDKVKKIEEMEIPGGAPSDVSFMGSLKKEDKTIQIGEYNLTKSNDYEDLANAGLGGLGFTFKKSNPEKNDNNGNDDSLIDAIAKRTAKYMSEANA